MVMFSPLVRLPDAVFLRPQAGGNPMRAGETPQRSKILKSDVVDMRRVCVYIYIYMYKGFG